MATSSIFADLLISDAATATQFIQALELAEKKKNNCMKESNSEVCSILNDVEVKTFVDRLL